MSQTPTPKPITRVDLEAVGEGITRVSCWREGWADGSAPDVSETVEGAIIRLLMPYEDAGFTCEMMDQFHGRALRGKTTRVDLELILGKWHYRKYPYGWTAKTRAISDVVKTEEQVAEIVAWCESNGWTVFKRDGQIRAWRGDAKPIHDKRTIMAMRRRANNDRRDFFTDFAYMG